ncbi:alpha/beta fold hydrolase [Microbacterium sp. NPDC057407]|uniref:alpha/beta fold hydrolase n=1 Tax=Microbacterium sp. NPDC057407 TaxID=3346120 RepID=UPI00366D7894
MPAVALTAPNGPDGAPLLVLGPSLGTSTILWESVAPLLQDRFRVTAWDLPGHGASPAAGGPFTVADLADAVAVVVDEEQFLYAGVSLGGATGLELALRHPGRVRAAAILASGAQLGEPAAWHERAEQARAQSTSSLIVGSAQRWFADGSVAKHPELTGRLLHALAAADDESYARCCEALAEYDVRDRLGEISAPVLAVWGEHDRVAPQAKAAEIASGVPRGESAMVPDAAHLPPAEQPEAVADLLRRFFARVEGDADVTTGR